MSPRRRTAPSGTDPKPADVPNVPQADPEGVAKAILETGAPVNAATARSRRFRERKAKEAEAPASPPEVTEADILMATGAGVFVWDLVVLPLSKGRIKSLDDEQAKRWGRSLAPLILKYGPLLGQWMPEILALGTTVALIRECRKSPEELERDRVAAEVAKRESEAKRESDAAGPAAV